MAHFYTVVIFLVICFIIPVSAKQPNIVFVLADDLGYADIGYHGGAGQIKTPTLDKLAREGVQLENYYVEPLCTPSRSALMSGRNPIHTGLQHMVILPAQPNGLRLDLPTLPNKLKEAGYSTHMIGKWHLGFYKVDYTPTRRGFDTFYGYYQGAEDYFNHTSNYALVGELSAPHHVGLDLHDGLKPDRNQTGKYSANLFTERAVDVIKQKAKSDEPLFLYMAYQNIHQPYQVPEIYEKQYSSIKNSDRRKLAGMVSALDEGIANITQALKDNGLWDNTIIIFSSDNGGMTQAGGAVGCNYPLRGSKASLWEGGIRVAGFVSGPLVKQQGINRELMHISDWYPTIVKLGKGSIDGLTLDGFDQWPTISGQKPSPRKEILYNIDPMWPKFGLKRRNSKFDNRMMAGLRMGDMKLITGMPFFSGWYKPVQVEGEVEEAVHYEAGRLKQQGLLQNIFLFNITADPTERHDLSKEMPDTVDMMLDRLAEYDATAVPVDYPAADPASDPAKHGGSWEPWQ